MRSTLMKVGLWIGGSALALGVLLGGARALADRLGHRGMQHRLHALLDGAVDAAQPDATQRRAIESARQRALGAWRGAGRDHRRLVEEALALFEADTLDAGRVTAIRDERLAEMRRVGNAVAAALTEVHGVLRPEQRRAAAGYLREHRPAHGPGWRGGLAKRLASARIERFLDDVAATPAQRAAIEAARERVFAAFESSFQEADLQLADRGLALFEADTIDAAQLQALRTEHQGRSERVADAVVQAVRDVHQALVPEQRHLLAAEVREHLGRLHERHHGHHGRRGLPRGPEAAPAQP